MINYSYIIIIDIYIYINIVYILFYHKQSTKILTITRYIWVCLQIRVPSKSKLKKIGDRLSDRPQKNL